MSEYKPISLFSPGELPGEEEACATRQYSPFPDPWETAVSDLSRRYFRTRKRFQHIFVGDLSEQSFLVETPRGLGVIWRLWGESLHIVAATIENGAVVRKPGVICLSPEESAASTFIIDRIMATVPRWTSS